VRAACAGLGDFVLVLDGDGQHQARDAGRLVARLGEYDLVIGARSAATQASGSGGWERRAERSGRLPDRSRDP